MIVMPKMPDFSKMSLLDKLRVNCAMREAAGVCDIDSYCLGCPLYAVDNYYEWKANQPKKRIIKWPLKQKDKFFVLPRVEMNQMSTNWKRKMLKLLNEFMSTPAASDVKFRVMAIKNGRGVRMPEIYKNY